MHVQPPLDERLRSDLLRLFGLMEIDPTHDYDQREPFLFVGLPHPALLFRDEALRLLRTLQRTLAGSALAQGGPSPKASEELVLDACRTFVVDGADAALLSIAAAISEPPSPWNFIESINAHLPHEELELGHCRLLRGGTEDLAPDAVSPFVRGRVPAPFVVVEVRARDQESARLLARDRIDETRAILVLASGDRGSFPPHVLSRSDQGHTFAGGERRLIASDLWDSERRVHPTYRGLSEAAALAEEERSDWARRAVAAARWYANAAETHWPSEALTSCMTALEALFVRDRRVVNKGSEIADRFTERWVARGRSPNEQREWLRSLYRARNDAIHEGRRFVEDLQIDRLIDLTGAAVRWGSWHLNIHHSDRQAACETFDEVMEHDLSRAV